MMISMTSKARARSPNTRDIVSWWLISLGKYLPTSFGPQRSSSLAIVAPKTSRCSSRIFLRVNQTMGSTYYNRKNIAVPHRTPSLDYTDRYYNTALAPIILVSNSHPNWVLGPIPYRTYSRHCFKIHACQTKVVSSVTASDLSYHIC